ncbi:hypothetical protein PCANC_15193 [Puccinia coronata f. sp. avenae]|uniref:Uncharacterized protein n=1 Tax=Puccinia coronata f. sp. avenae TaxID=200324 RepID=A0A2N5UFB5_9BASI|nr:hypothetical protein PCASD_17759 [Puccinia coronata f. sp. avenae]PLW36441.1 hypothetical protein PCANC_15193 [Puccinia coronata f. sp. avenae]
MSDITLILAEMKAQGNEDRVRRDRNDARSRRKADLDEQTCVTAIVGAVTRRFRPEDIQKPDGSNIRQWECMLRLHAAERFQDPHYFLGNDKAIIDPSDKMIAQGIINSSISSDLTYVILDFASFFDIYKHLISKFRVVNRAAQLQLWNEFLAVDPAKLSTTAALYKKLNHIGNAFHKKGLVLSWEVMTGLIIHNNLRDSLCQSVDQKVELFMESHNYQVPTYTTNCDQQCLNVTSDVEPTCPTPPKSFGVYQSGRYWGMTLA